jgi:hypothetical protein
LGRLFWLARTLDSANNRSEGTKSVVRQLSSFTASDGGPRKYLIAEDQVYSRIPQHGSYAGQVVLMQEIEASAQYFERTFRR